MSSAIRIDRSELVPLTGLSLAVPMAAVLAVGLLASDPGAGAAMTVGALFVGIASRARGAFPPLGTMVWATAVIGLSIFVGSSTGQISGLHLILVAMWSFLGGMVLAVEPRQSIVGVMGIIAFVVLGRFPESPSGALSWPALPSPAAQPRSPLLQPFAT